MEYLPAFLRPTFVDQEIRDDFIHENQTTVDKVTAMHLIKTAELKALTLSKEVDPLKGTKQRDLMEELLRLEQKLKFFRSQRKTVQRSLDAQLRSEEAKKAYDLLVMQEERRLATGLNPADLEVLAERANEYSIAMGMEEEDLDESLREFVAQTQMSTLDYLEEPKTDFPAPVGAGPFEVPVEVQK